MIFAGVSASQITKIFITHFHGDHCLGLAGVLQRLSLDRIEHEVEIYYPKYGQKYIDSLRTSSIYHNVAKIKERPFEKEGMIFESKTLTIEARKLDHTVETFGYRFQEKDDVTMIPEKLNAFGVFRNNIGKLKKAGKIDIDGRIIELSDVSVFKKGVGLGFVMDTRMCKNAVELAQNVDYLVCESTYLSAEIADATKNGHLTSKQAAEIAKKANVGNLILTHFSQRYISIKEFVIEAKEIFENTIAVKDGDEVDILRNK